MPDAALPPDRGLGATLGFEITEAGPDRVVLAFDAGERHHQPFGLVHGGVHCAAVEHVASVGATLWLQQQLGRDDVTAVGVANQTDFLRSARTGRLTVIGTPIHRGRTQQLWLAEVADEGGKAIARGQVRLQNLTG